MKQFYFLSRIVFIGMFALMLFSCEKEEEFMSPETSIVKDSSEKKIKVPNLQDVQNNFKSKTSVNKLFQHSSISKSNSEMVIFSFMN